MQVGIAKTVRDLFRVIVLGVAAMVVVGLAGAARGEEPSLPVLLDFYADWCGPCQGMQPAVDQLAREGYDVRRVNVDQTPDLATRFGVQSVPTFVVVERGAEVDRVVGATSIERLKVKLRLPAPLVARPQPLAPRPAWRYERPVGRFAPVVRISVDLASGHALGSGVLVRWAGRNVVLTARHVIKDAKQIVVTLFDGQEARSQGSGRLGMGLCGVGARGGSGRGAGGGRNGPGRGVSPGGPAGVVRLRRGRNPPGGQ